MAYEYIENVSTLRGLPNVNHSMNAVAIKIPNEDKSNGLYNSITYGQLHDLIEDTATALVNIVGIEKGDVIAIPLPNSVEYILSFLAVPWTRAVSAPLNPNYTEKEYKFYMEDNKSKCVLVPKEGLPEAEAAAKDLGIPVYTVKWTADSSGGGGSVKIVRKDSGEDAETKEDDDDDAKLTFAPDPDDVALFLHTSGTTARPKVCKVKKEDCVTISIFRAQLLNNITFLFTLLYHAILYGV
jgi:acyl-CoA synthetase (AMP-forming)/AMP-acid ligase II